MRKRLLVGSLLVVTLTSAGLLPAAEGRNRQQRVVKTDYMCPCGNSVTGERIMGSGRVRFGGAIVETRPTDFFVRVQVRDELGQTVWFYLDQDDEGDGYDRQDEIGNFCGSTGKRPLKLSGPSAHELRIFIGSGPCPSSEDGIAVATRGTIRVAFSKSR